MKVRHSSLKNEPINTRYGIVQLDDLGYVKNIDDLTCNEEQLIQHVPGFINGDLFPPKDGLLPGKLTKTAPAAEVKEKDTKEADTYAEVIKELLAAGANTTEDGYIDMGVLNQTLRDKGLKIMTGTDRKKLSDERNLKAGAKPSDGPKLPVENV